MRNFSMIHWKKYIYLTQLWVPISVAKNAFENKAIHHSFNDQLHFIWSFYSEAFVFSLRACLCVCVFILCNIVDLHLIKEKVKHKTQIDVKQAF